MRVLFAILLISVWCLNANANSASLKIVVQENNVFLDAILPEMLSEAKIEAEILRRPSERTLYELDAGVIDGNGLRLRVLEGLYPNVIRMNEPVEFIDFIAITNKKDVTVTKWADLVNYKVAYPTGWKIFDLNVPKEATVMKANKQGQLFQMLNIGRVDVVLLSAPIARTLLKQTDVAGIRFLKPALHQTPAYLFFHNTRIEEAERLSEALKKLKQNGIYNKTYTRVYQNH